MLDWFAGYVGYDASGAKLPKCLLLSPSGEIVKEYDRWHSEQGSYSDNILITKTSARSDMLEAKRRFGFLCSDSVYSISGNPTKFLQGHNVAGPSVSQLGPVLQGLFRSLSKNIRPPDSDSEVLPAVWRTRVDIEKHIDLDSHTAVHEWLNLAHNCTRSRHGRALQSGSTLYWGKHSRRWTLKAYCKHCELLKHPPTVPNIASLIQSWTFPHLRIELTLRRPELKDRGTLDDDILWEFFEKIEVNTMKVTSLAKANLINSEKITLKLWSNGEDVKTLLPKVTFYRHRSNILKETGIDISLPMQSQAKENRSVFLGVKELREREVKDIPEIIKNSLFHLNVA